MIIEKNFKKFKIEKFFNKNLKNISQNLIFSNNFYIKKFDYYRELYEGYFKEKDFKKNIKKYNIYFINLEKINYFNNIENLSEQEFYKLKPNIISIDNIENQQAGYYFTKINDLCILISNFCINKNKDKVYLTKFSQKENLIETFLFFHILKEEMYKNIFFNNIDLKFLLFFNKNIYQCIMFNEKTEEKKIYIKYKNNSFSKSLENNLNKENIFFYNIENIKLKEEKKEPNFFKMIFYKNIEESKKNQNSLYIDIYNIDIEIKNLFYDKILSKFEDENMYCENKNLFAFFNTEKVKKIEYDISDINNIDFRYLVKNEEESFLAIKNIKNYLSIHFLDNSFFNKNKKTESLYYMFEDKNISKIKGPGKILLSYKYLPNNKDIFKIEDIKYYFFINGKFLDDERYLNTIQPQLSEKDFLEFYFKYFSQ